jgi:hypothetical protein
MVYPEDIEALAPNVTALAFPTAWILRGPTSRIADVLEACQNVKVWLAEE